jgi:hypothetical protein
MINYLGVSRTRLLPSAILSVALAIVLVFSTTPTISRGAQPNPRTPDTDFLQLTSAAQVAELYFALSGDDPDYIKLTEMVDPTYSSLQNEFDKRDAVAKNRPLIDKAIEKLKGHHYFRFTIGNMSPLPLEHYNFAMRSFHLTTLPPGSGSYLYFDGPGYVTHLGVTNADDYQMLKIQDESKARAIENMLSKPLSSDVVYYLYANDTSNTAAGSLLIVECQIVHVVLHANGQTLYRF